MATKYRLCDHSPLPWRVDRSFVVGKNGESIADMLQWTDGGPANGEFITRACNSHDNLVESLRQLANEVAGMLGSTNLTVLKLRLDEARAALAQESTT